MKKHQTNKDQPLNHSLIMSSLTFDTVNIDTVNIREINIDEVNVDTDELHSRHKVSARVPSPIDWRAVALALTLHVFLLGILIAGGLSIPSLLSEHAVDSTVDNTVDTETLINARLIDLPPLPPLTKESDLSLAAQDVIAEVAPPQHLRENTPSNQSPSAPKTDREDSLEPLKMADTEQWMPSVDNTPPIAVSPFQIRRQNGLEQSDLLSQSTLSILPEETRRIIQGHDSQQLQSLSQQASQDYRYDAISPVFPAAPAPLGKEEQVIKTIMQAKIDLDCASTINQALVIISTFTLQTAVCQNKGNFQQFIDKRLQEKLPPPKIKGVAELKQLARSDDTDMHAQPPTR